VEVQVPMLLPHEVLHELHQAGSLQAGMFGKKTVCSQGANGTCEMCLILAVYPAVLSIHDWLQVKPKHT